MKAEQASDPSIFLWLSGHVRNVGDSMLRRPLSDLYRSAGDIHVWTGAPGTGYEAGLRLAETESAPSFLQWVRDYTTATLRGRPTFVFNAGEFAVTKAYFFGIIILAPTLLLARAKGARIVWVGAGVRGRRRFFMWPFDALARAASDLRWRDVASTGLMGRGDVMPDWGFGLGPGGEVAPAITDPGVRDRVTMTISLRGDRERPSDHWVDSVRKLAERLGLGVVCVAQVEDDDELARELANKLGADIVGWGDGDHWEQEKRVRAAYSRSALTLSDRLHGLIIAATEGSVPLGWCEATTIKIANHFDVVGAEWVSCGDVSPVQLIDGLERSQLKALSARSAAVMSAARARVDAVRAALLEAERVR